MTNTDNITENTERKILKNFKEILDANDEDFGYIEIPDDEMTINKQKIIGHVGKIVRLESKF